MKKTKILLISMLMLLIPIVVIGSTFTKNKTYDIAANEGYRIVDVIVNGVTQGPITSYTFTNMKGSQDIKIVTERLEYTVTYNANGGTGSMSSQTFKHGLSQKLNTNTYTKEGYAFNGWSTTAGGAVEYEDGANYITTENTILYAVWGLYGDANNDGQANTGDSVSILRYLIGKEEINLKNADVNLDGTVNEYDQYLISQYTVSNVTSLPYTGSKVIIVCKSNNGVPDMDKYYFAEPGETVTLSGSYYDGSITKGWATTPDGEVVYESGASYTATTNTMLYGVWARMYVVTYDANGGTGTMSGQVFLEGTAQNLTPNTFTREGYVFNGWSTTANGSVEYTDGESYTATGNATLYAVWERNVLYGDANDDGLVDIMDVQKIYNYLNNTTSEINLINADVNIDGIIDIYDEHIINHYLVRNVEQLPHDGKVVIFDNYEEDYIQLFEIGETKTLELNQEEREGYVFNGWSTTADGAVEYADGANYTANNNITLYAVWIAATPTAILYSDGTMVFQSDDVVDSSKTVTATYTGWDTAQYNSYSSKVPWYNEMASIISVVIEDGVSPAYTDYWFADATSLSNISIGDGIFKIGDSMFMRSGTATTSIELPSTVTSIDGYGFYNSYFASVTIPDSVTSIGNGAFALQRTMTTITIPASVTYIGTNAFNQMMKLTSISVDSNNQNYCSDSGILFNKSKTILIDYPVKKTDSTYVIPNGVTEISKNAFYGQWYLNSITLPSTLQTIGDYAFYNVYELTNVVIPDSVVSIGMKAFAKIQSATTFTFGSNIASIGTNAFDASSSYGESTYIGTTVIGGNSVVRSYDWAGDYRTVTFN